MRLISMCALLFHILFKFHTVPADLSSQSAGSSSFNSAAGDSKTDAAVGVNPTSTQMTHTPSPVELEENESVMSSSGTFYCDNQWCYVNCYH